MITGVDTLILITIASLLVEAIVETFKTIAECKRNDWKCIITKVMVIIVGIVIAVAYNLKLPDLFGLNLSKLPYVSQILTGILISRGSNFVHDLYNRLQAAKLPIQLLGTIIPATAAGTNVTMQTDQGATTAVNIASSKTDPAPAAPADPMVTAAAAAMSAAQSAAQAAQSASDAAQAAQTTDIKDTIIKP